MSELEYHRWKNFSMRMACRGLGLRRRKSRMFVARAVKWFFRVALEGNYLQWAKGTKDDGLLGRIVDWDHTAPHPTWRDVFGHESNGPYVCDIVSQMEEHFNPHYCGDEWAYSRWNELWWSRVSCCIRAGLDVAASPSAGVLGFTVGDLRRMYCGKVPEWVSGGDERWEVQHWDGVVPGVGLIPGKREVNGTFAEMPDETGVWL